MGDVLLCIFWHFAPSNLLKLIVRYEKIDSFGEAKVLIL